MDAKSTPQVEHMQCFVGGKWLDSDKRLEVRNPYTKQLVGTVPLLSAKQVGEAVDALAKAAGGGKWERIKGKNA